MFRINQNAAARALIRRSLEDDNREETGQGSSRVVSKVYHWNSPEAFFSLSQHFSTTTVEWDGTKAQRERQIGS